MKLDPVWNFNFVSQSDIIFLKHLFRVQFWDNLTFGVTTLSITTLSITKSSIQIAGTQYYDGQYTVLLCCVVYSQYRIFIVMLRITMLIVTCYKCRIFVAVLSVVVLSVIRLNVVAPIFELRLFRTFVQINMILFRLKLNR